MKVRSGWRLLIALALTYVALGLFFVFPYGGGPVVGALATLELLAMLALGLGVAWAAGHRR